MSFLTVNTNILELGKYPIGQTSIFHLNNMRCKLFSNQNSIKFLPLYQEEVDPVISIELTIDFSGKDVSFSNFINSVDSNFF